MDINIKLLILFSMIFCHIVDDYYLQGILAKLKQKSWWEENAPQKMYKKDYLVALFMHGFSWSFMVHLPFTIYFIVTGCIPYELIAVSCFGHAIAHAIVDHAKANCKVINLIQDQAIHMIQIVLIFIIIVVI